jgi:epsilon-lactone hydrolase
MPSWQARLFSKFLRLLVKPRLHRLGMDEAEAVRRIRRALEPNDFLKPLLPHAAKVEPVDSVAVTAALEDAVRGYRLLLENGETPERIVIGGDSAGGGLTLATLLALRDRGLPLPGGAFCLSPWTDLAATGGSLITNEEKDPMITGKRMKEFAGIYYGDAAPTDPLVSPLYGDLIGLPPLLIYVSNTEVLLDDSVRFAARAKKHGVKVDLRIWNDLPHVWPVFIAFKLPEARQAISEIAEFIKQQTSLQQAKRNAA